jgi:hypothetical protein
LYLLVAPVFIQEIDAPVVFAGGAAYTLAEYMAEVMEATKATLSGGFTHRHGAVTEHKLRLL